MDRVRATVTQLMLSSSRILYLHLLWPILRRGAISRAGGKRLIHDEGGRLQAPTSSRKLRSSKANCPGFRCR